MRKNRRLTTSAKNNSHVVSIITAALMTLFMIGMLLSSLSAHADTYSGTYNGDDYGTWAISLDGKGINKAVAITWSDQTNIGSSGAVLTQTASKVTLQFSNNSRITANIDFTGHVTGTWSNGSSSGTISGNEIDSDEVKQYNTQYFFMSENNCWTDMHIGYGVISGDGSFGIGKGIITPEDEIYYIAGDTILYGSLYTGKTYKTNGAKGTYYITTLDYVNKTNIAVANAKNAEIAANNKAGCFIGGLL